MTITSFEQVFEAATAANAMAFIRKAPAGMRTLVSSPSQLSMYCSGSLLSEVDSCSDGVTSCMLLMSYAESVPSLGGVDARRIPMYYLYVT